MSRYLIGFLAGAAFTGPLFQFDLNFPNYSQSAHKQLLKKHKQVSAKNKQLLKKQSNANKLVQARRSNLSDKHGKRLLSKSGAALIPGLGVVVVAGLSVEEYCRDIKDNIELSNILGDESEPHDYNKCLEDAKNEAISFWSLTGQWWDDWSFFDDADVTPAEE